MWIGFRGLAVLTAVTMVAACSTPRGPVEDPGKIALLGFLQPGGAARAEVENRLGPPAHVYEGGKVVTYALEERNGRLTAMVYSGRPGYTLVLEYDAQGKLARRALVERR